MSDAMIRVERLGKRYRIQHQRGRERYVALRDVLSHSLAAPLRWARQRSLGAAETTEDFWALKDVEFEVMQGEVTGIIGRNGAGKSTLLKVLSRITEPTEGRIIMRGRVASLLEVGTGFHPELSGRDNIYLNGAILGMTRAEIAGKFDEIVAFAGTERFLDTPVKRYSSGMYVRLAFAVAAHIEPEILVIDEVLAVGDAEFQQKCLGKMGEVARGGRTVLFVSHHLATVENLCRTAVLLDKGRVKAGGPVREVIAAYTSDVARSGHQSTIDRLDRQGNGVVRFWEVRLLDAAERPVGALVAGAAALVDLRLRNTGKASLRSVHISVGIDNSLGQRVTTWSTAYAGGDFPSAPGADFVVRVRLPRVALVPGGYSYSLFATVNGEVADWLMPGGWFEVDPGDFYGSGQLPGTRDGTFITDHAFELRA